MIALFRRLMLLLVLTLAAPVWAEMSVHFIDVGEGGGVLIQKDGKTILYDCGDTFAGPTVLDYLEALDAWKRAHLGTASVLDPTSDRRTIP